MSGMLAGAALAAQRVLGQPASAVQAARQVLEARPMAQTEQEDEESPPVFEAPTSEELAAGQPEPSRFRTEVATRTTAVMRKGRA